MLQRHGNAYSNDHRSTELNLPPIVAKWLGLKDKDASYVDERDQGTNLTVQNDAQGLSFESIADLVESNPKNMFVEEE